MASLNPMQKAVVNMAANVLASSGHKLAKIEPVRHWVVGRVENRMLSELKKSRRDSTYLPGIAEDRTMMGLGIMGSIERALVEDRLSDSARRAISRILIQTLFIEQGDQAAVHRFQNRYGMRPPTFLVISPGMGCNLRCSGCYADSGEIAKNLDWDIVDRIITEAKTLWGSRFFVISGGEPFAYRSQGKGITEIIEKHSDCIFVMFTNGTLINSRLSKRLAKAGNLLPAISVEGWKERTDARRGAGVFEKVLAAIKLLREDGIPFGISLTATRHNAEEILSDEFIDFFQQQGALFGWIFQYMPIGRSFTLDLMPTPQQRVWMWKRSWEIVRGKRMFLADFWNHSTACDGCLSAGGHGSGGYFYVNWNGVISPCVFLPYSPLNIKEVYASGKTLNDVWTDPFFRSLRKWQLDYKRRNANGLAPCPNRDHYLDLQQILREHEPDPIDENAAAALLDPNYARGLAEYEAVFESLTQDIWERHYVHRVSSEKDVIPPLPDLLNSPVTPANEAVKNHETKTAGVD